MELAFEEKKWPFYKPVVRQNLYQEETAEAFVPESCPDNVRILSCTGQVLLRGKDCRDGSVTLSGGVQTAVLLASDEGQIWPVEAYIPFSVRVDHPALTGAAQVLCRCCIRSVDARMQGPRKMLIRVNVGCAVTACEASEQITWNLNAPQTVQVQRTTFPVRHLEAMGEKAFVVSEEMELAAGESPIDEICHWNANLILSEQKTIGSRVVFKGIVAVQVLYRGADTVLHNWAFSVPFSQYAELDRECESEACCVVPILTGAELTMDAQTDANRVQLTLNVLAQCAAIGQHEVEAVTDLYSTECLLTPEMAELQTENLLDSQTLHQTLREMIAAPASEVLETTVYLDFPTQQRNGEIVEVQAGAQVSLLYRDMAGQLQSLTRRMEAFCQTQLHPAGLLRPQAALTEAATALVGSDGMEVCIPMQFQLDSFAAERVAICCGAVEAEWPVDQMEQPSVVLRAAAPDETLWSLAKGCHTTVAAICEANQLTEEAILQPGTMLLIPMQVS